MKEEITLLYSVLRSDQYPQTFLNYILRGIETRRSTSARGKCNSRVISRHKKDAAENICRIFNKVKISLPQRTEPLYLIKNRSNYITSHK